MSEKQAITLRIEATTIEGFKRLAEETPGGKYQALMNDALKAYLEKPSLESRVLKLEAAVFKKNKRE